MNDDEIIIFPAHFNKSQEKKYINPKDIPLRLSHYIIDENGNKVLKRYPTQDQLWNRDLYQRGLLDELPITEPFDEWLIQKVESKRKITEKYYEQKQEAEKQQLKKQIQKAVKDLFDGIGGKR